MDVTARDEGLGIGVESCGSDDKSHGLNDEGHSVECDGLSLREEEAVPGGHGSGSTPEPERPERVSASRQPTLTTWIDPEDDSKTGSEVDAENTGSVVDGKVNVDTDGDGIGGSLQALIPLVGPALDRSLRLLRL
ncbi:hypothetical protein Tco_1086097 [Tanacetum coccineum]